MTTLLNETVYRFEADYQAGRDPRVEDYLPDTESRNLVLTELIHIDLEYRLKQRESARIEDWLQRFPGLEQDREALLGLVHAEFELRSRFESPGLAEYCERFPWLADELSQQLRTGSASGSAGVVRCPDCRTALPVSHDTELSDLSCSACGSQIRLVAESMSQGDLLGPFELIEQIGVGGFGAVWRARDPQLQRDVAIKVPRHQLVEADAEAFFREARATAGLRHPNIVTTYEVGRDGERIYIASDFIEGRTLSEVLAEQRFSAREATRLCLAICSALECAHAAGVVHRDLKPANIMINERSEPIVMDFGLAKHDAGGVTMTVDGRILGTPAYMSPEQAAGEAHAADQRSDLYSLGVILFQSLTGEVPFRGGVRVVLQQVLEADPPSPRSLEPLVPRDLETICLRCLEKDPANRFSSAAALSAELVRFLNGEPIESRPVSRVERTVRWCRRKPVAAALGLLLFLLAVTAPVVAVVQSRLRAQADLATGRLSDALDRLREENAKTLAAQAETARANSALKVSLADAQEQARRARTAAYSAQLRDARRAIDVGEIGDAIRCLQRCDPALRGWEYGYLRALCARHCTVYHIGRARDVVFVRNGSLLLENHGSRVVLRGLDGELVRSFEVPELSRPDIRAVAFSETSSRVLALDRTGLSTLWDADSGERVRWFRLAGIEAPAAWRPHGLAIHPSEPIAAVSSGVSRKVFIVSLENGEVLRTMSYDSRLRDDWCQRLTWSPDGSVLVSAGEKLMSFHTEGAVKPMPGMRGWHAEAFAPNGLLFAEWALWETDRAAPVRLPRRTSVLQLEGPALSGKALQAAKGLTYPSAGHLVSAAFSPDGRMLATALEDGEILLWSTDDFRTIHRFAHLESLRSIAWGPDGTLLVRGVDTVTQWHVRTLLDGGDSAPLQIAREKQQPAIHQQLIASRSDEAVRLTNEGKLVGEIANSGVAGALEFCGDGRFLLVGHREGNAYGSPGRVVAYDSGTLQPVSTLELGEGYYAGSSVAVIPGTTRFVTPRQDGLVVVDAETGQVVKSLDLPPSARGERKPPTRITQVTATPDGRFVYVRIVYEGLMRIGLETGEVAGRIDDTKIWAMAASNGRVAVAFSDRVEVRDESLDTVLSTLTGFRGRPLTLTFSSDGSRLFAAGEGGSVRVFEAASGIELFVERVTSFRPGTSQLMQLRFAPDGSTVRVNGTTEELRAVTYELESHGP